MLGEGALDNAVRLLRNPWLRATLRELPLPADVGQLIALLGGHTERVEVAARAMGLPADTVLEAARFYAQEVLMFRGADDRRVLGLGEDDGLEVARSHFRALQAWLHPDRMADAAEAIYATRVNVAWRRFRALDAQPREGVTSVGLDQAAVVRIPRWQPIDEAATSGQRALAGVVVVLLVACSGLLWLTLRSTPIPELPALTLENVALTTQLVAAPIATGADSHRAPQRALLLATPGHVVKSVPNESTPGVGPDSLGGGPGISVLTEASTPTAKPAPTLSPKSAVVSRAARAVPSDAATPTTRGDDSASSRPGALAFASGGDAPRAEVPAPALEARLDKARQRTQRLLKYLTDAKSTIPPIWRSGSALVAAESAHAEIMAGANMFRRPRVLEHEAHWVLGLDEVTVRVPVQPAARNSMPRPLRATLRWHEGEWWVSNVELENAP